ncbi:MAG: hypothetical protein HOV77_16280 [Hamadaea sp.]|uniref:hypothetical protein n=1 Tax=Hamadaea sp. TaxID=2024425 RepID=UPI0017E6BA4A|nr:hypothetical protein [Hamadaea sp.]NUT20742.1 hypothetical protein [Hamadaea sp.]
MVGSCGLLRYDRGPTPDEIRATAEETATKAARTAAEAYAAGLLRSITRDTELLEVATGAEDWCIGGKGEMAGRHTEYRVKCTQRTETVLSGGRADLVSILRRVDAAAKHAGSYSAGNLDGLENFLQRNGIDADGRLMSCPQLVYSYLGPSPPAEVRSAGDWSIAVDWIDDRRPKPTHCHIDASPFVWPSPDVGGPYVVRREPLDRASATAGYKNQALIIVSVFGVYFTSPWE